MGNKMIWIEEKLADKLEIVNDIVKITNEDINKIIKKLADDTDTMTNCLDENMLKFKLHAQQTRDKYKAVVEEEIDATYKLWEECEDLREKAKTKMDSVIPVTKNISENIKSISQAISSCNLYGINSVIDIINKFNNMNDEDKELLALLLNYKKFE